MNTVSMDSSEDAVALLRLKERYDRDAETTINLYAGANVTSPMVDRALSWGFGSMPAMGRPFRKDQPGTDQISALEVLVERQLRDLFGGTWAEARLPSCTLANLAIYQTFGRGGVLLSSDGSNAGHVSGRSDGAPAMAGMTVVSLPYRNGGFLIDDEAAARRVDELRPSILLLGGSITLSVDLPPKTIAAARACGTIVVYDGSHVAGLIAGDKTPDPLRNGAHILTASTYKSLGGPPGGVVIGTEEHHGAALRPVVCPVLSSNYDAGRVAALSVALAEAKMFMPLYASGMIDAAILLRDALQAQGIATIPARDEPQSTHQFLIPSGGEAAARALMRVFEAHGILIGMNRLPPGREYCLRVGTQILARRRYSGEALQVLASLMAGIIEHGGGEAVQADVAGLAKSHTEVGYAFSS